MKHYLYVKVFGASSWSIAIPIFQLCDRLRAVFPAPGFCCPKTTADPAWLGQDALQRSTLQCLCWSIPVRKSA